MKLDHEPFYRWIDYIGKTRYKIMCTWLGPLYPIVCIHHPDPLRKTRKCPKDEFLMNLATVTGDGFLTITADPKWQRNRRLLTPAFHYHILKSYIAVYNSCVEVFLLQHVDGCSKQETACQSG